MLWGMLLTPPISEPFMAIDFLAQVIINSCQTLLQIPDSLMQAEDFVLPNFNPRLGVAMYFISNAISALVGLLFPCMLSHLHKETHQKSLRPSNIPSVRQELLQREAKTGSHPRELNHQNCCGAQVSNRQHLVSLLPLPNAKMCWTVSCWNEVSMDVVGRGHKPTPIAPALDHVLPVRVAGLRLHIGVVLQVLVQ